MARGLNVVGDPWVLLIVRNVLQGHGRFEALRDSLGISEAVLSRRLSAMVDAGLLTRVAYTNGGRTRQGYAATEAAADLLPVIQQLAIWAEKHTTTPPRSGHMAMIHEACGQETTQGEICSACGEVLVAEQMTWVKPWRNARDALVAAGTVTSVD